MSRVGWARTAADDVEGVIACMLCRENPRAQRVRPAQGDGGIDVYTPDDVGNWTVYQVKSFTGALNASHKRQIRKSWNAFLAFVASRQLTVDAWYLVRPEDPTPNDIAWLAKLTEGSAYRCEWRGLSFCDRLAADHQSVIDYYLHEGKERLQTSVSELMAAMHSGAEAMTQPGETLRTLEAIHTTINSIDPHFRYDFRVDTLPLDANGAPVMPGLDTYPQDMLTAATSAGPGGRAITYLIYARYQEAVSDRPLPTKFTFTAEPGTADAEALQDFYDYGMPLSGITAINLDLVLPAVLARRVRAMGSSGSGHLKSRQRNRDACNSSSSRPTPIMSWLQWTWIWNLPREVWVVMKNSR